MNMYVLRKEISKTKEVSRFKEQTETSALKNEIAVPSYSSSNVCIKYCQ